ncbi:hypothetical protein [Nocardia sp. IFM 10818]
MTVRPALFTGLLVTTFATALCGGPGAPALADPAEEQYPRSLCLRAQVTTASLHLGKFRKAGGELHEAPYTDLGSFAASKPQVQPLTVTSYTTYEDSGTGLPRQVRCKGKSADHLAEVYGARTAGPEGTCAQVNRGTLKQVAGSLTDAEREALVFRPNRVVIDPDTLATTGQDWLSDFPTATVDSAGTLHLPAKALHVPLDTPGIPDAFKGQHYCTLIAPEHLKRILLGAVHPS